VQVICRVCAAICVADRPDPTALQPPRRRRPQRTLATTTITTTITTATITTTTATSSSGVDAHVRSLVVVKKVHVQILDAKVPKRVFELPVECLQRVLV
jgi:hypothetical protein